MNPLARIRSAVSAIAQRRAAPEELRSAYKRGLHERRVRSYNAAAVDRLASAWSTSPVSADASVRQNLRQLRARSREQYRNNDFARRFIHMVKSNVIGPTGIGLQARVREFGSSGPVDTLANDAIESAWYDWGKRQNCDVARRLSWVEAQRLFIATVAMDGEALIEIVGADNPYKTSLRFMDPELLNVDYNHVFRDGSSIVMGVEYSATGEVVAYHVNTQTTPVNGYISSDSVPKRIPASRMIHAFIPEAVGQTRGIPWMSTALLRLRMLEGYADAALVAARVGAAKMGFYESQDGEGYDGTDEDGLGNPIEDVEPGTFTNLPRGVKVSSWSPDYPTGEMEAFVKLMLRGISSGLGVSYNALANDLEGVNYSSIRAGVLEEREAWKSIQEWMVESFCTPVYEQWLGRALLVGAIKVPSKSGAPSPLPYVKQDKFRFVSWTPRRWSWVDPLNDMEAAAKGVEMGVTTLSQIIRDSGGEPEDVWRERAAEKELIKSMGLEFGPPAPQPRPAPASDSPADPEEPDKDDPEDMDTSGGTEVTANAASD